MRDVKRLYSIILVTLALIFLLILFSSAVSASPIKTTITRITNSGSAQSPCIYEDKIVYSDYCNGHYQIFMYNLSTSNETLIEDNKYSVYFPGVYGDRIIWCEDFHKDSSLINELIKYCKDSIKTILEYIVRFELWSRNPGELKCNIWMYNLSTHEKIQIATNESYQASPKIYGDKVVWEGLCDTNGAHDVYLYDLSANKKTQITTSGAANSPFIHKDMIIYYDFRSGNTLTYMYNISTARETRFPTNDFIGIISSINNDRVVYGGYNGGINTEFCVYNLSTGQETKITTVGNAVSPIIYGDRIVWIHEEDNTIKWDVYVYNLSTQKETRISTSGTAAFPIIYGNIIVWEDRQYKRNDLIISDIYVCKLNSTAVYYFFCKIIIGSTSFFCSHTKLRIESQWLIYSHS